MLLTKCDAPRRARMRANINPKPNLNMQVLISKNEAVAGRVVGHVRGLEAEVDVLKHLDHPNIVRYLARPRRAAPASPAARRVPELCPRAARLPL